MTTPLKKVTNANYFDHDINQEFKSCSQIKRAAHCMAGWKAERDLEYERPHSPALLLGSYADNALTEDGVTFQRFIEENAAKIFSYGKREKGKKKEFKELDAAIEHVKEDPIWMSYLEGKTQEVLYFEDFLGHRFRAKLDILNFDEAFITDLKTCKGVEERFYVERLRARLPWIQAFGYEMQAALYCHAVYMKYKFHPGYYIAAMEKEDPFNHDIFDMMDMVTADDQKIVPVDDLFAQRRAEAKLIMDRMEAAKDTPHYELQRCEYCKYCISTKKVMKPRKTFFDVRGMDF